MTPENPSHAAAGGDESADDEPADDPLAVAEALVAEDDISGLIRHLRGAGDRLPLADLARVLHAAARSSGFDDLAEAAADLVGAEAGGDAEDRARALFDFGYTCIERGIAFLAIRPLSAAVELEPAVVSIRTELAAAYEREFRHREAVAVLRAHEGDLPWLARFQLTYNTILAGDLVQAEEAFAALPLPEEPDWVPAREKVRAMLVRAATARVQDGALGPRDLRGWHFALTGGVLINISPWGYDAGMTGRWAMVGDSYGSIVEVLRRVALVLRSRGLRPRSVSVLPDRDSRILGLAAALWFGLPAVPFEPDRGDTLVVAYDLNEADPETLAALRARRPGQVLFERATNWTDAPLAAADVCGFLRQSVMTPWGSKLRMVDGQAVRTDPDPRPADEIAAELAAAAADVDAGDGATPLDTDEVLLEFVGGVGESWLGAPREYVGSPGPVPSSRFG
ncbi:hypothetical protein GCM10009839_16380 [Catenulispora yoronensis]|uniref:Uncharacterized protein n=1 Tax=Catenulispora yoronensis TaxID=450799 RepID=A0ABN2TSY5_9ACTN